MALRWSPVERLRRVRSDVWGHGWGGGTSFGGPSAGQGPSQKTAYGFQGPAGTRNSVSGNGRQGPRWRFTHKIKQQKKSWLFPWKLYGNWVGTSQTRPSYLSHWDNLKVSSLVTWSENPHPTGWQTAGQYRPGDGQPQLQQYPQQHGWQRGGQRLGGPGSDQSTIKHLVEFRTAWHVSRLSKYELFGSESFISIIFWYLLILYSFKLSLKFPPFFGSMHYCIHLLKNSSFQRFEVRESEPKEPKTSRTSRLSVVVRKRPMNKREVHRVDFPGWFWLCLVGWEKRFFFSGFLLGWIHLRMHLIVWGLVSFFSLYGKTGLKYKMWRLDDRYSLRSKTWSCAGGAFDGEVDGFFWTTQSTGYVHWNLLHPGNKAWLRGSLGS